MVVKAAINKNSTSTEYIPGFMNHRQVHERHKTQTSPMTIPCEIQLHLVQGQLSHEGELLVGPSQERIEATRSHTPHIPSIYSAPLRHLHNLNHHTVGSVRLASSNLEISNLQMTAPTGGSRTGHGVKGRTLWKEFASLKQV